MTTGPSTQSPWAEPAPQLLGDSAFDRLWRGFMTARVCIAIVLFTLLASLHTLAPALGVDPWLVAMCGCYLAATLAVRVFAQPQQPGRTFDPQWVSTIGVDLVVFAALQYLQAGNINYAPLFGLPVLLAAVLGSGLLALGTAAGVTLLLLAEAWVMALQLPAESAGRFLQAGLTGTGYFALALLANQLAARLAREERAARHGQQAARVQAQVNELIIENLSDGVLVVDADGRVRAANPAARTLLGPAASSAPGAFVLAGASVWQPLVDLAHHTFIERAAQVRDLAIDAGAGGAQRFLVRTRLTAPYDNPDQSLCVIFLEDLREMEARLRTDKLAAMGRMSAAVAHEIRNPLAAIAQANGLLEEDLVDPAQRQLSALVRQNTLRLAQIVDDILDISRVRGQGAGQPGPLIELDRSALAACADWGLQVRCGDRLRVVPGAGGAQVAFEPDHLRRVLVNLLDNALRYAGVQPGAIVVSTHPPAGDSGPALQVWSAGAPLEASVHRHLFEPFFSSESRSSGLGLYICRELCERHGAQILYRRTPGPAGAHGEGRDGNVFSVTFRTPAALAGAPSFDTMAA